MSSVKEQVWAAAFALVEGIPGFTALRNPLREPDAAEIPALIFEDGARVTENLTTGAEQYVVDFTITIYVTGDDLEADLDAAYVEVLKVFKKDRILGGVAVDTRDESDTEPEYVRDKGHAPYAVVVVEFVAQYWTDELDPEIVAPSP